MLALGFATQRVFITTKPKGTQIAVLLIAYESLLSKRIFVNRLSKTWASRKTLSYGDHWESMINVAVMADDLTGASDTGVQFRRAFSSVYVADHKHFYRTRFEPSPDVISIYTSSRALPGKAAYEAVVTASHHLRKWQPEHLYKKVDSCLRGNVGMETDGLMKSFGIHLAFIAPAFPGQGRTTVHDRHLLFDIPVAETEMGDDPICPVRESSLTRRFLTDSELKTGHIDLNVMLGGYDKVAVEIDRLIQHGTAKITFDATERDHLDLIVDLALRRFPHAVLVGSAGLAESLACRIGDITAANDPAMIPAHGNLLVVCGSASEKLRVQAEQLGKSCRCSRMVLETDRLVDAKDRVWRKDKAFAAAQILDKESLLLQIQPRGEKSSLPTAVKVVKGLAEVVMGIVEKSKPSCLFLSGGDTAFEVLHSLGANSIRLDVQVLPGLAQGTIVGGVLADRTVVTKAGSFGTPDTLIQFYHYWLGEKKSK